MLPHHEHQAELMRVVLGLLGEALALGGGRTEQRGVLLLWPLLMLEQELRSRSYPLQSWQSRL
jgi:hypothetical protein